MNNRSYLAIKHEKKNYDDIHDLRKIFDGANNTSRRSHEHSYFNWKLNLNPVKKGICAIVESEKRTVGMASITPKKMLFQNKIFLTAEIGDTFTHPDFQRKGIFSQVVNKVRSISENENIDFIYGTPNQNSLPGYKKKLNYDVLKSVDVKNFVYPINFSHILQQKIKSNFIISPLSFILKQLLEFKNYCFKPKLSNNIFFEEIERFPKIIDSLFDELNLSYDVVTSRNSEYLNWRFITNPDKYVCFLAKNGDKIIGYIVLKRGTWSELSVGYIADIFVFDNNEVNYFKYLINFATTYFKNNKYDMISIWLQSGPLSKILKKHGYLSFKDVPIICYKNEVGNKFLNGNYSWYFTMADSDNI